MPKARAEWNALISRWTSKTWTRTAVIESAGATASTFHKVSQSTESTSNSAAFSRALELLQHIDFSPDIEGILEDTLVDYVGKIEHYSNHRLPGHLNSFELPETQWQQIHLAADFARSVHEINETSADTIFVPGNPLGSTRPFCLHMTTLGQQNNILVIAIRGTRTKMEWMANTNVDPVDCKELGNEIRCHRGFASIARNMQSLLSTELDRILLDVPEEICILFTGHSSGAAVAQLLFGFMHSTSSLLARFTLDSRITDIDCVTFGGPPISDQPIPHHSPTPSMFLSFMNEGDPVALAQKDYIQTLVQAWVQPLTSSDANWPIPEPIYLPSGTQIALKSEIKEDDGKESISAFIVDLDTYKSVLFGDPGMHSMTIYKERICSILRQLSNPQNPFRDPPQDL